MTDLLPTLTGTGTTGTGWAGSAACGSAVIDELTRFAGAVDCDPTADRRPVLRELAARGLLDLGLVGERTSKSDQALVLAELAGACMTTAFCAWAHRMTLEYVSIGGTDTARSALEALRGVERIGSTAMASTFRAASGQAELTVSIDRAGNGDPLATGVIPWASNLHPDAVIVTGMKWGDDRRIVVFDLSAPGVRVAPSSRLMALDASQSGSIHLEATPIPEAQILDVEFGAFVDTVRPTFLTFQSALCVGLAGASLDSIEELTGVARSLSGRVVDARDELERVSHGVECATRWLDHRDGPPPRNLVRLRLDAAHLATEATQLELAVRGGQGFAASSATARRVREALFLPVQSPTEAQLQWELQHSA